MKEAVVTQEFAVHPYVQFMEDVYDPYTKWLAQEGLPIVNGEYVFDVRTMELGDWTRRNGRGAYLTFADQRVADAYVLWFVLWLDHAAASTVRRDPDGRERPRRHLDLVG